MNEELSFMGVKGHVKIELFDAITNKLVQKTEGYNLITDYGKARLKDHFLMCVVALFGCQRFINEDNLLSVISSSRSNSYGVFKTLYLTDDSSVPSPSDIAVSGNTVGVCPRYPNSSSDPTWGTINQNECRATREQMKLVFDFGTDKANGTFQSIQWCEMTNREQSNTDYSYQEIGVLPRSYASVVQSDDGYFYGVYSTTLYKIDPDTMQEIETYTLPVSSSGRNGHFDVNEGYCCYGGSNTLYIYKLSDKSYTTATLRGSNNYGGAILGGYFYSGYDTNYVYRVKLSDGTTENKTCPLYNYKNIGRMNGQLCYQLNSYGTTIYTYNYDANTHEAIEGTFSHSLLLGGCTQTYQAMLGIVNRRAYIASSASEGNSLTYYALRLDYQPPPRRNLVAKKRLDAPVTKNNQQTMKITYTFNFV